MKAYREDITAQEVRRLLDYDPLTGVLTNKIARGRRIKAGTTAGYTRPDGYRMVCLNYGRYLVHRIAWLHVYGYWPKGQVDHIDQNPMNNAILNLRECNDAENAQNLDPRGYGSSGYLGVTVYHHDPSKWVAKIKLHGKHTNLGIYRCKTAAYVAYCRAKAAMHTFAHGDAVSAVVKAHQ